MIKNDIQLERGFYKIIIKLQIGREIALFSNLEHFIVLL